MAIPNGLTPVVETINAKKPIISAAVEGATRTLHPSESGSLILLDRAAGIVVTLPAAPKGAYYDFAATVSVTSNSYKIITGGEYLIGSVISDDTDTSHAMAFFVADGGTHIAVAMNGSTTGGIKGTRLRFTSLSTTLWLVEGVNYGSGTVATPFANS